MDYIEDDDMADGVYGEDFAGHGDLHAGRRAGERHPRGLTGPTDVTFSVCVDPAPQEGEVVVLKGSLDELRDGVPMRPCETGGGRLWTVTVQLNVTGATATATGDMSATIFGVLGMASLSGGLRGAPPPLFEATYAIRNAGGTQVLVEDTPQQEQGPLRQYYYHCAKFPSTPESSLDEAFPLFIHDEVHLLQAGTNGAREFLSRFLRLAAAPFAKKRHLLDKALEELITVHWGVDAVPPHHVVLALAATLGYFRRQHNSGPALVPFDNDDYYMCLGFNPSGMASTSQENEKDQPSSLVVCRWIVKHCPARSDVVEEEDRHIRGRDRDGNLSSHQLMRYTQMGVLQAAETLYMGEKTFEWLKLLNFLPEHALPPPLNASQCEERDKLTESFHETMGKVFSSFNQQRKDLRHSNIEDKKELAKQGQAVNANIELLLRGLSAFCPSADGLQRLIMTVRTDYPELLETVIPMMLNRLRSLHFGPQDKETLRGMIASFPFMQSDECAISLLTNQYHPSKPFRAQEVVQFVKSVTETRDNVRPAGPQLQSAMRRWLMRHYGRPPERADRKEEKPNPASMTTSELSTHKEEIRDAIRCAIEGWHMVLALPCFKQEEETLRMILFELSQAYFFKDPDPLVVLDCMLDLENDIKSSTTVRQLEGELQRIAIKSVRDAQDTSEVEHHEDLLQLLFQTPTTLRFVIIEAFIGFKQASVSLGAMLSNEPIWSHLLSRPWVEAKGINEHPLGTTQKTGIAMLAKSAAELNKGTIHLNTLHTILSTQRVYEKLVMQVCEKPQTIPDSQSKLHKFDTEYNQVRAYVKMFCPLAHIEASKLNVLIDNIKDNYATLELRVAVSKFEGLPVRPHLPWLYSLRSSEVFSKIWKEVAKPPSDTSSAMLKQEYVVSQVIPKARACWEQLAKNIETGSAVLKDIRWCVNLEWAKVQHELELLENTAPKTAQWVPRAIDQTKAMRLAAKLREWAPSMLHLREVLEELFAKVQTDATVQELKTVVKQYEHMWEMPIGKMMDQVAPFKATINMLSEPMQDYTIKAAEHDQLLKWLLKHNSTEDFNRLIALCRPNTDDSLILAAIASLQQTRTFLAEALYSKPSTALYPGLRAFLLELASLHVDGTVHASLVSVQQSFDPMLELLTTHSRTPGAQACYDLKKISESGHFYVVCTLKESEQLICEVPDGSFNYEALAELRRQLLMTDVPVELDGATNLPEMLEELVEKFKLLEEYGRCTMELFTLGHFAYSVGQRVLSIKPRDPVATVEKHLTELQEKLAEWQGAVDNARGQHYFLNYFTVRELCHLVKEVPQIASNDHWESVWPLLRCVDLEADEKDTRKKGMSLWPLKVTGTSEAAMLNALGELLSGLFQASRPQVRTLDGLVLRQQLQGDLLIRSMQQREQGVPVFVCCADEPSKVTELVLSIYTRRSRVPEAEELKLCSSHTTLEEIELLLRRFFFARKYHREDRLYCLGNVHLLPYVVQCGTVEALRRLEEKFGFASASALVFVSGQQNQMLTNALSQRNLAVSVLPQESLMEAVAKVGEKYHGRQLEAVASQMNGVGKTHWILRTIQELQKKYGNQPVLHHVEIRETTDISALVTSLLKDPTSPQVPTAIHIDLAHILPSHVDTLLFELLVVGMLRDTQQCAVYHRRTQDFFFVEIPNTPAEHTATQLSFCLILPRTFLRMSAERIDTELPVLRTVNGATMVHFEENDSLVLVGKTLAAMKVEAFNPKSRDFNVTWVADTMPPINPRTVYGLLEEVCSSELSPPSFLVFMNFVRFLGQLVKLAENWNMMNLNLLQNFDPGLKHFKHCFFRLLIETSRDFALRQVPKAHGVVDASPLAPPAAQNMVRALSSGAPPPAGLARSVTEMSSQSSGMQRPRSRAAEIQQAQAAADLEVETGGVGRIEVSSYIKRFDMMPSWETCVHPIASFKKSESGTVVGCSIMSLQRDFLENFIDRNLQNSLNLNDLKLEKDWSKVTHQEAVYLVHLTEGGELLKKKEHLQGPKDYVVTVDNLLKLMSIQQRLKYGLPVILMGETGCGKTALVKFLAKTLEFRLFTLDIHGGITDETIMNFLDEALEEVDDRHGVLVFFDEINAANCMALFKTIIIDRMYGNKLIPANCRIISCCNPYRLRKHGELEDVALVFQHHLHDQTTGIHDPMKRLVYRVHPLPESLIDVVSDFGALSEKSEEIYINAILRKELPNMDDSGDNAAAHDADGQSDYDMFVAAFRELLCQSQIFVREVNEGERSVVSMRDIARAARVFKWFLTYYSKLRGVASLAVSDDQDGAMRVNITTEMRQHLRSAVILTLGYCYHSRLNREQRWGYRKRLCDTWKRMRAENANVEWLRLDDAAALNQLLTETQYEFVSQMELGEGIALNEALRENLFMLLVSIMNQIPILLIGKPGCSKSLAMGVLQNNLNGEVSNKEFFKSMPAVEVFAYQCSPLSTPDAILSAFHSARQSNLGHKSTIVCVLLDEVGLAEESPHLPLKVLHRELEDLRGIACVGISNWALDAAKMSRCVTLYRPPPTVEDLCVTAEGMVASANLKGYLRALSEAFFDIYQTQKRADFWGMREFYSTVRVINADLKLRAAEGKEAVLEPQVLMKTVQRNFGGQPAAEMETCIEEFFERTGMSFEQTPRYTTADLIQQNLLEPDARHLMLLTKNNAALRLLFESGLLDHNKAEVMFGSTFPNDQSDVFVAMNLQRIKSFMQQPISLVLVHCDSLYESLYDLLNQHYMEYAGQRYVRIAHGSKAKQCPIHRLFRVIVITEISDAYFRLAPPLLNRFEKQIFLRKDLMTRSDEALLNKLVKFWELLLDCMAEFKNRRSRAGADPEAREDGEEDAQAQACPRHRPIAGYHAELLSSLVFALRRKHGQTKNIDELFDEAKQMLTWVLTPEAVCITAAAGRGRRLMQLKLKLGFDLVSEYFEHQYHSDLLSFAEHLVSDKAHWCDELGAQVMVMTYSPIRGKIGQELQKVVDVTPLEVSLHELSSSQDIEKVVAEFYANAPEMKGNDGPIEKHFLLIHADPAAASLRMIEHCRFVCEKARSDFVTKGKGVPGSMFVNLVVHLQRGVDGNFSFDFDSQWHFVFLDSVEPSLDLNRMPALGSMLNMPLIEVVRGLEFPKLLKNCFRSSLSRLIYPHSRRPEDLQKQIQQILVYLEDGAFTDMIRTWVLRVLESTPKKSTTKDPTRVVSAEEGSVGQDKNWFAAIATDAHDLALAGTFRAALHNRIVVLISSLLTVLLAHLDRNGGLALLGEGSRRNLWLSISTASLTSPLSARLHNEAVTAIHEAATEQHEVGTDAHTSARPFVGHFPACWFVSRSIDGVRRIIEGLPSAEQLPALVSQYQLSKLHEVGLDPVLPPGMLDDYLSDFTAMHLDWTVRIGREVQQRILKKMITRVLGRDLTSVLEVHQLFWNSEKHISYCIALLNAVPNAVSGAEKLIDTAELETLNLELLLHVHQTMTSELSSPKVDTDSHSFYRDWLTRKMVVSGHTKEFMLSFGTAHEKLTKLKTDTEPRIETLALLLQHVAFPLHLPLDIINQFSKDLPGGKVRHSKTLFAILQLAQRIAHIDGALAKCSSFIESWILDVCLRDASAISDLEETCLRLVCSLSAGLPVVIEPHTLHGVAAGSLKDWSEQKDCGIATLPGQAGVIPRSSCLNLALLRKLIVAAEDDAKRIAIKKIEELLKEISEHEKHNDTTFATRYAVLCEEHAAGIMQELPGPEAWPDMSLSEVFCREDETSPARMLQDVGRIRWILTKYAAVLCKEDIDVHEHARCVPKVDPLLQTDNKRLESVCRSMRLYLLKCIERARGISYLRGLLAEPPLSDTRWVTKWRDLHDIDFEKFIGAALVPKWNPFAGEDGSAEYREAKVAVFEMMTSTATEKLDKFAKECAKKTPFQQKRDLGGLMMALTQEPGLLAALEDMDRRPVWRVKLNEWLMKTTDLPVSDKERMLLRIFAGDETAILSAPSPHVESLKPFIISGGTGASPKMDDILRWRVLGHLASVLLASPSGSVMAALRKIMLQPAELADGAPAFLPGMDEDIRNRVMKALLERGENIWKFKSHWYKCSCGYTFFIGECGRPMEVTACPGCHLQIGGRDHNKTTHTTEDDETDRSPAGYMLPRADKDEKHISFREVPATSARAVRLLLHGAMFCGVASVSGPCMPRIFDNLINTDSMCSMSEDSEAMYIGNHFSNDWRQLVDLMSSNVEDLAAMLHNLLRMVHIELRDDPKPGSGNAYGSAQASSSEAAPTVNWEKLSLTMRNSWEETVEAKYLLSMIKSNDTVQDLYKRWGGAAEDGKFVAELKEAADVRDFPRQKRELEMPQLWAFRSAVTLHALHKHVSIQRKATEALPVLCTVLQQPLFPVLKALGMLVGVFEWHSLVINHFSGRITRTDAAKLRVGEVLSSLPPTERQKWERAFKQFERAWHIAWPYVDRYECRVFSENLKQVMVNRDSEMLWCIAEGKDEGLCPLAITQWLVERHNELVQVVSASMGYPARKVSSRLLGQHDVINYDEGELMRFLRSRCVTYGVGGKLNFDFKLLENHLGRELSRPEITMELRGFQWLGEYFTGGNELKSVIKQKDLMPDMIERLRVELASPSVAHSCLQKVQMSTSFILKSGAGLSVEHAGEMLLSEYLRSVLSENPDSLPSATARSQVHLWHVDAFTKLLKQIINKDPMDSIDPKYQADLPKDLEESLVAVKPRLPEALLEVLGNFAETRLTETYIGDEVPMMDCLSQVIQELDLSQDAADAITNHLPHGLLMKHWASVYRILQAR